MYPCVYLCVPAVSDGRVLLQGVAERGDLLRQALQHLVPAGGRLGAVEAVHGGGVVQGEHLGGGGGGGCGFSFGVWGDTTGQTDSKKKKKKPPHLRLVRQEGHVDLLQGLHHLGDSGPPDQSEQTVWTICRAVERGRVYRQVTRGDTPWRT